MRRLLGSNNSESENNVRIRKSMLPRYIVAFVILYGASERAFSTATTFAIVNDAG